MEIHWIKKEFDNDTVNRQKSIEFLAKEFNVEKEHVIKTIEFCANKTKATEEELINLVLHTTYFLKKIRMNFRDSVILYAALLNQGFSEYDIQRYIFNLDLIGAALLEGYVRSIKDVLRKKKRED